jgi:hypothetical protein
VSLTLAIIVKISPRLCQTCIDAEERTVKYVTFPSEESSIWLDDRSFDHELKISYKMRGQNLHLWMDYRLAITAESTGDSQNVCIHPTLEPVK